MLRTRSCETPNNRVYHAAMDLLRTNSTSSTCTTAACQQLANQIKSSLAAHPNDIDPCPNFDQRESTSSFHGYRPFAQLLVLTRSLFCFLSGVWRAGFQGPGTSHAQQYQCIH